MGFPVVVFQLLFHLAESFCIFVLLLKVLALFPSRGSDLDLIKLSSPISSLRPLIKNNGGRTAFVLVSRGQGRQVSSRSCSVLSPAFLCLLPRLSERQAHTAPCPRRSVWWPLRRANPVWHATGFYGAGRGFYFIFPDSTQLGVKGFQTLPVLCTKTSGHANSHLSRGL